MTIWREMEGNGAYFSAALLLGMIVLQMQVMDLQASHVLWDKHALAAMMKEADNQGVTPAEDSYRTAFHFQPFSHWMNDPNAPMFYKGYYHLFYQYNPQSAVWGMIRWGHAVSKDLINWKHLEGAAIYPDKWYNINGAWSGSATFLNNKSNKENNVPVILYTGNTIEAVQVTLMAVPADPSDPLLRHWKQSPHNPIMTPDSSINVSSFRDPTTAWRGSNGVWRVLIGNKKLHHNNVGMALLYTSKDFIHWKKARHPLHSANTGMWECPDFYPVLLNGSEGLDRSVKRDFGSVKYVLKNSLDNYKVDYYTVGKYLADVDRFVPDNGSVEGPDGLRYDYGKFYASKTFFDQNSGRRILWGWINESDSVADDVSRGWAGLQAIPRKVWLDPASQGKVLQWPVKEVESLRGHNVVRENIVLSKQSYIEIDGFRSGASQLDVEVEFEEIGGSDMAYERVENLEGRTAQSLCSNSMTKNGFGLMVLASQDLTERSSVFFKFFVDSRNEKLQKLALCVDQSKSTLRENADKMSYGSFVNMDEKWPNSLSLRVLVDKSIVESFAEGGKACITSRSYPIKAIDSEAHLFVFSNFSSSSVRVSRLSAWEMNPANTTYEADI